MNNELPDGTIDWILAAGESLAMRTESVEEPKADPKDEDSWFSGIYPENSVADAK